jgi:hypothetical protein
VVLALAVIASAQQATKAEAPAQKTNGNNTSPCSTQSAPTSLAATPAPDLSNAARDKCKKDDDCHWDTAKGCVCVIVLDGDGSNVLRIDTQSSTVQKNTADYEYERLPVERRIGGIISLP